jgi:uncharacterized protein YecE (DUF72 family)
LICTKQAACTFPRPEYLQKLADAVPDDFRFGFKVTDTVTIKKFPRLDRFGTNAGQQNPNFLNADLFAMAFLKPCEEIRDKVGVLMFEFSQFWPSDYEHGRDFVSDLDGFLEKLPKGWPYAIEMRNKHWLAPEYFSCLARHSVTHVFNSWDAMPSVSEQMASPGSRPNPNLIAARFLLKPGRKYEEAVKTFQPYDKVKEQNPDARAAGKALVAEGKAAGPDRKTLIYVNNRLERNALETIDATLSDAEQPNNQTVWSQQFGVELSRKTMGSCRRHRQEKPFRQLTIFVFAASTNWSMKPLACAFAILTPPAVVRRCPSAPTARQTRSQPIRAGQASSASWCSRQRALWSSVC